MAAEKGKIKVINAGSGGIITDSRGTVEYEFLQPNHKELCLNVGDKVKYELISAKAGTVAVAVNVERITAGVVVSVDGHGGVIEERQTQKKVKFFQPFARESGLTPGDIVRYSLINAADGEIAVNLTEVDE
jgi:hypothetical protein